MCVSLSGVLFSVGVCVCVSLSGVVFSVCVCDLLIFYRSPSSRRPPSSVIKCLWEVFVWGVRVLFLCACVSLSGVLFSVGVCVCVTC